MIIGSSPWKAALAAGQKQPLYILDVGLLNPGGSPQYITSFVYDPDNPIVTDAGTATFLPYMQIPQGVSQSIDELEAHSSVSQFTVNCIDPGGELKAFASDVLAVGSVASFFMGFPGLSLTNIGQSGSDFPTMEKRRVVSIDMTTDGLISIVMSDYLADLIQDIWVNGGPDAWVPGQATNAAPAVPPAYADNGQPISSDNPRYLSGNPIDLLLVACQNELGIGQTLPPFLVVNSGGSGASGTGSVGYGINPSWSFFTPGNDATLINPNPFIDIPGILALRDEFFAGDRFEFAITSSAAGKSWIEDEIMKPLGLFWTTTASGLLTLRSLKNFVPADIQIVRIDQNSIIGIPELGRRPVLNVIQCTLPLTDDPGLDGDQAPINFAQQKSLDQNSRTIRPHELNADGLRFGLGGDTRLWMTSNRIFNRNAFVVPVYTFTAFFSQVYMEACDLFQVTCPLLLDLNNAVRGLNNVVCQIWDRTPNYSAGTVTFQVLDTRAMGWPDGPFSYEIAAAADSIPDWGSATEAQKETYLFINADTPTEDRGLIL